MPGFGLFGWGLFLISVPVLPTPIAKPGSAAPAIAFVALPDFEFDDGFVGVDGVVVDVVLIVDDNDDVISGVGVDTSSFLSFFQNFQPASESSI